MATPSDDGFPPTRREFLLRCGVGLGAIALGNRLGQTFAPTIASTDDDPLAPRPPHFAPRAKSVIYLFMNGAPSQLDLFDHKPKLNELHGQPIPSELVKTERFAFIKGKPRILGSPFKFAPHGRCGAEVSQLLPHIASIVDDITIVKSVRTDAFNHAPAELFINTGLARIGRPSMGSWVTFGLGSECRDLPGFTVLLSGGGQPSGGYACWGNGFLPSVFQGVQLRAARDAVLFVRNPDGMSDDTRRRSLDALRDLNDERARSVGDPEIAARVQAFELAHRMQSSVPELTDLSAESPQTLAAYGVTPGQPSFATNCLLARRMVERGVRFVHLYHRGWDSHGTGPSDDLEHSLPKRCLETDQACAALVNDLKQRGLLDSTLVIWGGEFGRTPMNEARNGSTYLGRDHHPRAFTMWFAGGGTKRGFTLGETDELGWDVVRDPVHVHDVQATVLHLLGLDHKRLTFRFQGRDFRLTDVHGEVVQSLIA